MNCPKCQSTEFDNSGVCLVCGYQTQGSAASARLALAESAFQKDAVLPFENQASADEALNQQAEMPEWRLELSRRLQEIKSRREVGDVVPPAVDPTVNPEPEPAKDKSEEEPKPPPFKLASPKKPRRSTRTVAHDPIQDTDPAGTTTQASASPVAYQDHRIPLVPDALPLEKQALHRSSNAVPAPQTEEDIKKLIDTVVAQQAVPERTPISTRKGMSSATKMAVPPPAGEEPREGKLILLSRTLAGLVDMIIIIVCSSMFLFAVDVLEGIEVFDAVSVIHYFLLLLATYLVYSLFFLGIGSQTIGMMLTDLRVVGTMARRPKANQIIIRCLAFLVGLSAIGVGLLWGCFDRQSRCLHDWLSRTRVERA